MGSNQSSPLETQDEYYPGGSEQYAIDQQKKIDEEERARAEEAARKAEEDRKRQEEENRIREQQRLKREAEERIRAEEEAAYIKANTPFQKPTAPTLALTNKLSRPCLNCDIVIPPGLSSSTVILSRDIIGKQPKVVKLPMLAPIGNQNDPSGPGRYLIGNGSLATIYSRNFLVPADPMNIIYVAKGQFFLVNIGGKFACMCAFPNKKFPEVWVDGRPSKEYTYNEYVTINKEQESEYNENSDKLKNPELGIMLWNPSETKGDKGAVAVNYRTHGALTKVFLKPTIPFSITYGINADVEKAERKEKERLKKKKEAEDKKKAEGK
jgi:hypothetical protein